MSVISWTQLIKDIFIRLLLMITIDSISGSEHDKNGWDSMKTGWKTNRLRGDEVEVGRVTQIILTYLLLPNHQSQMFRFGSIIRSEHFWRIRKFTHLKETEWLFRKFHV